MSSSVQPLPFEQPIVELHQQLAELESGDKSSSKDVRSEIKELKKQIQDEFGRIPKNLSLVAAVGGGSSSLGFWMHMIDSGCKLNVCEAGGPKKFRNKHKNHIAITYINCSAEIKALSDIIVTSSNAAKIINSIPKNKKIVFAPDRHLGNYLNKLFCFYRFLRIKKSMIKQYMGTQLLIPKMMLRLVAQERQLI